MYPAQSGASAMSVTPLLDEVVTLGAPWRLSRTIPHRTQ
jgi:hypothetical protein